MEERKNYCFLYGYRALDLDTVLNISESQYIIMVKQEEIYKMLSNLFDKKVVISHLRPTFLEYKRNQEVRLKLYENEIMDVLRKKFNNFTGIDDSSITSIQTDVATILKILDDNYSNEFNEYIAYIEKTVIEGGGTL